jgi:hypothetical protein
MTIHDLRFTIHDLRNPLELNKPAEFTYYHPFFALQPTRQRGSVGFLGLALHAKPYLTICTLAIPAEVAVRDRIN